jgi:hypothetical protein
VNQTRFLALMVLIAFAYSLATFYGQWLHHGGVEMYAGRNLKTYQKVPVHSDFCLALYGQRWCYAMELYSDLAVALMALKPHKSLFFQRGLHALSLIQHAF